MTPMTALLVVAAAGLLAGWPAVRVFVVAQEAVPIHYRGFTLSAGRCEPGESSCALQSPKNWTTAETEIIKKAIDQIVVHPKGKDVVARTQERSLGTVRRYALGLSNSVPVPAIAAMLRREHPPIGIDLHDRFFATPDARDAYSGTPGYLLVAQALLHECMHAIDDLSWQPDFLKITGFVRAGQGWRFGIQTPDDLAALTQFPNELARLEKAGDVFGQWQLNRRLALNMRPVRVPTMQSLRSPAEAFAEIGSHLILDPNAKKYLPSELVVYFETNVFRSHAGN